MNSEYTSSLNALISITTVFFLLWDKLTVIQTLKDILVKLTTYFAFALVYPNSQHFQGEEMSIVQMSHNIFLQIALDER